MSSVMATRNTNKMLNLTAFLVIEEHRRLTGRYPTGLHFNKVMSLSHRALRQRGIDIELPHCWYRYGDEVVRQRMPTFVRWNHEEPSHCKISWAGKGPEKGRGVPNADQILDVVGALVRKYSVAGGTSVAVGEVYSYAPFDFQRRFRRLMPYLERLGRTHRGTTKTERAVALAYLTRACEAFPLDEFPTVAQRLPAFRSAMTHAMSHRKVPPALPAELAEVFWFWFCYHLRLHPTAHENVPEEVLEYWASRLGGHDARSNRVLGDLVLELRGLLPEVNSDPDLKAIATARKDERKSEERILADFESDLDGLDEFVKAIRSVPSSRRLA